MAKKLIAFLSQDIWNIRTNTVTRAKATLIKTGRLLLLTYRGFTQDKCFLQASAMTFFSLMSIVPVFALLFGIAKGFGLEKTLNTLLYEKLPGQETAIEWIMSAAQKMLDNTQGGLVTGIGVVLLFWSVLKLLTNIELSFNHIWGIKSPRTLQRRFADYLAICVMCPIILVLANSVSGFVAFYLVKITDSVPFFSTFMGPIVSSLIRLIPYVLMWFLFAFLYIVVPNTAVSFPAGIVGGIIGGTVYQIVQWAYLHFQIGISKAGAIYGSLSALPLFLVWLQISWVIVLLGAEIAYAFQNLSFYEREPQVSNLNRYGKNVLSISIASLVVKYFLSESRPTPAQEIIETLDLPPRLANELLFDLTEAGVLTSIQDEATKAHRYQPGRDPHALTVESVMSALEKTGSTLLLDSVASDLASVREKIDNCLEGLRKNPNNLALKDL